MINQQKFLNAIEQDIQMVKGDTCIFNFQIAGLGEGVSPSFVLACKTIPDSTVGNSFSVSSASGDIVQEEYDSSTDTYTYSVCISPGKTTVRNAGRYYYDLQMTLDDNIYTLMRGRLELLYEVSE